MKLFSWTVLEVGVDVDTFRGVTEWPGDEVVRENSAASSVVQFSPSVRTLRRKATWVKNRWKFSPGCTLFCILVICCSMRLKLQTCLQTCNVAWIHYHTLGHKKVLNQFSSDISNIRNGSVNPVIPLESPSNLLFCATFVLWSLDFRNEWFWLIAVRFFSRLSGWLWYCISYEQKFILEGVISNPVNFGPLVLILWIFRSQTQALSCTQQSNGQCHSFTQYPKLP